MAPETIILNLAYVVNGAVLLISEIFWFRVILMIAQMFMLSFAFLTGKATVFIWSSIFFSINLLQIIIIFRERRPLIIPKDLIFYFENIFKSMSDREFLSFWHAGSLKTTNDAPLCYEGEKMDELILITKGSVEVIVNGHVVAHLSQGQFVAEMSFISGKPASATVKAIGEVEFLSWNQEKLAHLKKDNQMMLIKLQETLGKDLVLKLVKST